MSFNSEKKINKENIDKLLAELSKEYKKKGGKRAPVEMVLIGGAAILVNYGFRDSTEDVDAIMSSHTIMKEAIQSIAERNNLPSDWVNSDFKRTASFSNKLILRSRMYKTFNQVLNVRVVEGAYLIAMKLISNRDYKNDLSDIVGVLREHKDRGMPITFNMIDDAVIDLYGSWKDISDEAFLNIKYLCNCNNLDEEYEKARNHEIDSKDYLINLVENDPNALKGKKVKDVMDELWERTKNKKK